ncbi:hypothetical protein [Tuwongella immobilis]|uniref:Uncharacterized protein n=1 Tax=Tuwongella immobilis TaxID=692036 RepID=A0A6C2YTQ6_9BACT|nr:hypothetical protein [Tuwongella immobilis]VIP04419.1 unnamed protein product [Tuwongella immobilis]VTS06200.1 unnamed protein product [Tuwongella immobilis]
MSAPMVTVFLPGYQDHAPLLRTVIDALRLNVDDLPPDFPFAWSAQRRGEDDLLVQYDADSTDTTREMQQWEKPSQDFKWLLQGCRSCIHVHYRKIELAKEFIILTGGYLGHSSSLSGFENGHGCLLRLTEVVEHCLGDPTWSWERESFPDISGVADSEWID